jgi:predicted MPP superfamily phosphohydrolase
MPTAWPSRLAERLGLVSLPCVEHHDVRIARPLGRATRLRIAFASDFHAGPVTSPRVLDEAITLLTRADADLVLLGGDFVSLRDGYAADLATRFAAIPARLGRYAVLGNHDHWAGGTAVAEHLRRAGIEVLMNSNLRLPDPFGNVSLCGIDDHESGEPDAAAAFAGAAPVRVLLMHQPSGLLDIGGQSFDVAVCGHTHGGQIALPGGRPIIVANGRLTRRYNAGRFVVEGERTLLVSRGVGCSGMPIRFNAPPAVMTCDLHGTALEP